MFLVPSSGLCGTYVYITISLYIILLYLIFGHDITGILLKVALDTIIETHCFSVLCCIDYTSFYDFSFWFWNCSDSVEFSFYSLTISIKAMNWNDIFISGWPFGSNSYFLIVFLFFFCFFCRFLKHWSKHIVDKK